MKSLKIHNESVFKELCKPMEEDMKKTAYIFMEFQKDFLSDAGKLNIAKEGCHFLKNAENILQFARGKNQQVIHIHLSFSFDYSELREDMDGVLALVKGAKAFQKGSNGVEAIDPFLPRANEICIYKNSISCFEGTDLEIRLREMEISDLVFTGLLSNVCIESSVRDAYDKGFRVHVVQDATSTIDERGHQHAVEHVLPLFSTVCMTDKVLQGNSL